MSIKSFIAIALAMCGSFTTILAVVGYVAQPPASTRHTSRSVTVPQAEKPLRQQISATFPGTNRRQEPPENERVIPDVPTQGAPHPLPDVVPAEMLNQFESALTPQQIQRMAKEAASRLEGVETSLNQQILALKKSRDLMLDQLADELKTQTPKEAAALLLSLDDELAVLSLKRLPTVKRRMVLEQIPGKRRARLQKLLR